jgi:hypothetical protein
LGANVRRRKNQRGNRRRLPHLISGDHLGSESQLESAGRIKLARGQEKLDGTIFREGWGDKTESQR